MKIRYIFIVTLAIALVALAAGLALAGPQEFYGAACRVSTPHGMGSGCCYSVDNRVVAVITCHHVVKGNRTAWVEFYRPSGRSAKILGQVIVSRPDVDAAVIVIPSHVFRGILPKALPPAKKLPRVGAKIATVGCPNGQDIQGYTATVSRYEGQDMIFAPAPAMGRSGSAIADYDGNEIVAILYAHQPSGRPVEGRATTITAIASAVDNQIQRTALAFDEAVENQEVVETQCAGGQCPGGQCAPQGNRIFGQRPQAQQPSVPWPNEELPGPAYDSAAGQRDPLLPYRQREAEEDRAIAQGLQGIRSDLQGLKQQQIVPPPSSGPIGPIADPQARAMAEQALGQVGELGKKVDAIAEPLANIKAKLEADAEKGGIKGKIAQRILDAAEGEDGEAKGELGLVQKVLHGKLIWIGLAILALFIIKDIKDKKTTGDPLLIEKVLDKVRGARDKATDFLPAPANIAVDGVLDKLHDKVDKLAAKLTDVALATPAPTQPPKTP